MTIYYIILICFVHFVADFVFQTSEQAANKHHDSVKLFNHVTIYSGTWLLVMPWILGINALIFVVITFCLHYAIDYTTSKINSNLFKKGNLHLFFVSVGFDQFLHIILLLITFLSLI